MLHDVFVLAVQAILMAPVPLFFLQPPALKMSAYMQKVGAKLFQQHLEKYTPPDPLYEYYTDAKGKQRRKKVNTAFSPQLRAHYQWADSFYSAMFLRGFLLAMQKFSRLFKVEHITSTKVSAFVVFVSAGRPSLELSLARAMSHVRR